MLYLAQFHAGALAAAALLGLGMGWIALVHRGAEIPSRWLIRIGLFLALLVVVSQAHLLHGRIGLSQLEVLQGRVGDIDLARPAYWLDLALLLFAAYVAGCALGTWLRSLLLARQNRRQVP